jgi:hypothetical protein
MLFSAFLKTNLLAQTKFAYYADDSVAVYTVLFFFFDANLFLLRSPLSCYNLYIIIIIIIYFICCTCAVLAKNMDQHMGSENPFTSKCYSCLLLRLYLWMVLRIFHFSPMWYICIFQHIFSLFLIMLHSMLFSLKFVPFCWWRYLFTTKKRKVYCIIYVSLTNVLVLVLVEYLPYGLLIVV